MPAGKTWLNYRMASGPGAEVSHQAPFCMSTAGLSQVRVET